MQTAGKKTVRTKFVYVFNIVPVASVGRFYDYSLFQKDFCHPKSLHGFSGDCQTVATHNYP